MMRFLLITIGLTLAIGLRAQEDFPKMKFEFKVDSLNLWTYEVSIPQKVDQKVIGKLSLYRTQPIIDSNSDTLWPSIHYLIYPISEFDSIAKFERSRTTALSCCYPKCGTTFQVCKNFIFWSDPWSISCSFDCNGKDYVRKNADNIFAKVKIDSYENLEELLLDFTIEKKN